MTRQELFENIIKKQSFLCIGLDTDVTKLPKTLPNSKESIFEFNKQIVDATADKAVCYKPNTAFYECYGLEGWKALEKTVSYIKNTYPDIFVIADAKRGDIGNTSKMYATAFLENMPCDAITVSPYMGVDSVEPFLTIKNKWVIVLALTSNAGSADFQQKFMDDDTLYEKVLKISSTWGNADNMMYVVGATKAEKLKEIRRIIPDHFLLIPGVGAQGGDLNEVAQNGINAHCGLLVNASRSIIYAGNGSDFADCARSEADKIQQQMAVILQEKNYLYR